MSPSAHDNRALGERLPGSTEVSIADSEQPAMQETAAQASHATSTSFAFDALQQDADMDFTPERFEYAMRLIQAALEQDFNRVKALVEDVHADAWVQDPIGWTALHAAAYTGNVDVIEYLLRTGNAVWQITDNLGFTAGDIAYSMNEKAAYDFLLQEGVRAELIRAALEGAAANEPEVVTEDDEVDMKEITAPQKSTASDNATFLASRLRFEQDASGQEIAVDELGNGVMMGWEAPIMRRTADRLCEAFASRRGSERIPDDAEELNVVNVGFGLGIIDSYLQEYRPTHHLVIEPHPDVLAYARSKGFDKRPGVRFFEGTWQQYFAALDSGDEEFVQFDAVYFDTYSEHYVDLHQFFDKLPDMLRGPESTFSFFHGLGARSRHLYDTYTLVSELHLKDTGLATEWEDVDLQDQIDWSGTTDKYWDQSVVGPYRLPVCRLDF